MGTKKGSNYVSLFLDPVQRIIYRTIKKTTRYKNTRLYGIEYRLNVKKILFFSILKLCKILIIRAIEQIAQAAQPVKCQNGQFGYTDQSTNIFSGDTKIDFNSVNVRAILNPPRSGQ